MKLLWRFVLPPLILWLAFAVRLYHLPFQSIWWDEGHSIFVASQPIPQIPTLPAMDVHPPAYFTLLHLWITLTGQCEFTLRYLSVLFSMLTIALLWRFAAALSRLIASPPHLTLPFLAALLAAVSPMYVAYAQEVRSYAMITLLALASTFLLWRIVFIFADSVVGGPKRRLRTRWSAVILYIFLTAACLYTHYFTLFLLLFHNITWFLWALQNVRKRVFIWIATQIGILLLFTPQLLLALRQVTSYTNPNLSPPSLIEFILRTWQAYTVGLTLDPGPAHWGMAIIAVIIAVIILLCLPPISKQLFDAPPSTLHPPSSILFLAGWFLIPLAAYFVILQRQPSFEPRYMILVTPAIFLLFALGLSNLLRPTLYALRTSSYVLSLLLFTVFLLSLHSYYTNEAYFKDDSAGVAAWLATETTANDLVYIDVPHPFHYYVAKGHISAPTRYLFVDIHTAADILTREAAGHDRLFWISWRGSDTDPRGVIPFLAQKYGEKLGQRDFRGYHVEWYSLPSAKVNYSLPTDLNPVNARFGDVLRLDGAAFGGYPPATNATPVNHPAWATLHFTLLRPTEVDYKVSLRLRGEDGQVEAQVDKELLNDRHFHTSAWPLPDPALNQAINVYTLSLAPDIPPGQYRLEVVVYNSQPPYPSEGVTGIESVDGTAAIIGTISIIP
jgi:uncharacterized membrane protein